LIAYFSYCCQLKINYKIITFNRALIALINITENIYTTLILEQLSVCLVCKNSGVQNPGLVKSYTIQRCKWFVTTSTSMLVCLSVLPWRYDAEIMAYIGLLA